MTVKKNNKLKAKDIANYFMYCVVNDKKPAFNYFKDWMEKDILKSRCKYLTICAYCIHIDLEKEKLKPLFKEKLLAGCYVPYFKSLNSKLIRFKPKNIIDTELKKYLDMIYKLYKKDTVFEITAMLHNTNAWKKAKLYKPLNKKLITQDFIKGWKYERKKKNNNRKERKERR